MYTLKLCLYIGHSRMCPFQRISTGWNSKCFLYFVLALLFMRPSSVVRSIKTFQDRADLYKKGIQD